MVSTFYLTYHQNALINFMETLFIRCKLKSVAAFQEFFGCINKDWALGCYSMKF